MIDLHIHTTSSDGSDEPKDILLKAQQLGLKYISITDHDSIGAYKKLSNDKINNYYEGKLIPGCEFSVAYNGRPIEILGYGIDLDVIEASGIVSEEKFFDRENSYLTELKEVCRNLDIRYSKSLSVNSKYFATQLLHSDIRKYPENEKHFTKEVWESLNAFYRTCVNNEKSPFFLDQLKNYPTVEEACGIIKKAGGKAFLAHLYVYFAEDYDEFLNSLVSMKVLDGIECYHSLHSIERTDYLLKYCIENKLYSSGGSDYHGDLKPDVRIGEAFLGRRIPYGILKPWHLESII